MNETIRSFIAIELDKEIQNQLSQIQKQLKTSGADVKWVEKDNIHLTLKYLGEIDEKKSESIKSILNEIAKSTKQFEISLKDIGAFPKIEFPRVIWVGLDKGAKESIELAGKIDEALSGLGFQKETRPFAAHLTIGRVRSPKNKDALKEKVQTANRTPLTANQQLVSSIILFQSALTPRGSIYTKLNESRLG